MKLLTLNTHSLMEPEYEKKSLCFADMAADTLPDVIALQEVNQSIAAETLDENALHGYVPCSSFTGKVRKDNHAVYAAKLLSERGVKYSWTWVPAKIGYDRYDEGLALFVRGEILETEEFTISASEDYSYWKTRKILGVCARIDGQKQWFYAVHMGWWKDEEEPFAAQWERVTAELTARRRFELPVWMLGDFNSPADERDTGYDCVKKSGWYDTYPLAKKRDAGFTVAGEIDGWRDGGAQENGMRIDYIWCSRPVEAEESKVVFNGKEYPVVSDHFGILLTV